MAWILSLKTLLISTAVVCVGLALKLSVPLALEFSASHVPLFWASLLSWLKPPYLYFIINCIIIGIAASSRFHHNSSDRHHQDDPALPTEAPEEISTEFGLLHSTVATQQQREEAVDDAAEVTKAVVVNGSAEDEDEEFLGSRSTWKRIDSSEYLSPAEKPLVSARFGHRKPFKASPEGGSGRTLRVAKPKRHETMENTWKAITEGRAMPLSRHMRKCDTWENHDRQIVNVDSPDPSPVNKSETFKDRTNLHQTLSPGCSKLRKEPSLSQEELNRRVEAFINKFNEEMKLQRQESLNQYMKMIDRGSH